MKPGICMFSTTRLLLPGWGDYQGTVWTDHQNIHVVDKSASALHSTFKSTQRSHSINPCHSGIHTLQLQSSWYRQ